MLAAQKPVITFRGGRGVHRATLNALLHTGSDHRLLTGVNWSTLLCCVEFPCAGLCHLNTHMYTPAHTTHARTHPITLTIPPGMCCCACNNRSEADLAGSQEGPCTFSPAINRRSAALLASSTDIPGGFLARQAWFWARAQEKAAALAAALEDGECSFSPSARGEVGAGQRGRGEDVVLVAGSRWVEGRGSGWVGHGCALI
jgi:hypothetical protein